MSRFADPLDGALWAASRGWAVHPCKGKEPLTKWADEASTDPHQVTAWLAGTSHNFGVAAAPSGLLIIDDDTGRALLDYAASLGESVPDTFTVDTARGCHYYFEQVEPAIGCSRGQLPPGIDVKGAGGYVIGPGSIHSTGVLYTPRNPDQVPVPPPAWLIKALGVPHASTAQSQRRAGEPVTFAQIGHTGPIPIGRRHERLLSYAGHLRARGLSLEEAKSLVAVRLMDCEQRPGDRFDQDAADAIVDDSYGRWEGPTVATEVVEQDPGLCLVRADQVQAGETEWIIDNVLPAAHPVIFIGDEGIGKGLWWSHLLGQVTTGPDAIDVIVIVAEDDPQETVVPRLVAVGADRSRIHFLVRDPETLTGVPVIPGDNAKVSALIEETGARLVIIDPWMSVVPGHLQVRDTQQARQALDPVTRMARRTGATFLLVTHTNRTGSEDARQRYGATIALRQAGRVCLMALPDPSDDQVIYVGVEKSNIGVTPPAVRYRKSGTGSQWRLFPDRDPVGLTIKELINVMGRDSDGRTTDKWTAVVVCATANGGLITRQEVITLYAEATDPVAAADKAIARWRNAMPPRLTPVSRQRGVFEVVAAKPPVVTPHYPHYSDMGGMGGIPHEPPVPPVLRDGDPWGVSAGGTRLEVAL